MSCTVSMIMKSYQNFLNLKEEWDCDWSTILIALCTLVHTAVHVQETVQIQLQVANNSQVKQQYASWSTLYTYASLV